VETRQGNTKIDKPDTQLSKGQNFVFSNLKITDSSNKFGNIGVLKIFEISSSTVLRSPVAIPAIMLVPERAPFL
jgi:hypothetical protein